MLAGSEPCQGPTLPWPLPNFLGEPQNSKGKAGLLQPVHSPGNRREGHLDPAVCLPWGLLGVQSVGVSSGLKFSEAGAGLAFLEAEAQWCREEGFQGKDPLANVDTK